MMVELYRGNFINSSLIFKIKKGINKRNTLLFLFSFFISYINIRIIKLKIYTNINESLYYMLIFFLTIILFFIINRFVDLPSKELSLRETNKKTLKRYFNIVLIFQILCWIPVWLAYYPSLFNYDINAQISMYYNGFTTKHPLIHSLYLIFFCGVGVLINNVNLTMAIGTFIQMMLFSFMLSFMHLLLYKCNVNKIIRTIVLLITSLSPYFSLLAISTTKDTLFSGFCCVFVSCLIYYSIDKNSILNRTNLIIYILSIIGCILFRNNGIFGVVAVLIILITRVKKDKSNLKLIKYTVIGMIVAIAINVILTLILCATSTTTLNESLSIPYQQISRVYKYEDIDNDTRLEIRKYIPEVEMYNELISDNVKRNGNAGSDLGDFISLYVKLGLKYTSTYVDAFLINNGSYLCIVDDTFASIYGTDPDERLGIFQTDIKENSYLYLDSKFEALENIYEKLYTSNDYQEFIFLRLFLNPALYVGLIILGFIYIIANNKDLPIAYMFTLVYFLTLLMGPTVQARYILPIIVCIPQLCLITFVDI